MARPDTVSEMLGTLARMFEVVDEWSFFSADRRGESVAPGQGSMQGDLRMLAAWLREHPDIDARMRAVLDAVDD